MTHQKLNTSYNCTFHILLKVIFFTNVSHGFFSFSENVSDSLWGFFFSFDLPWKVRVTPSGARPSQQRHTRVTKRPETVMSFDLWRERSDRALMCCAVCCPLTSLYFFFFYIYHVLLRSSSSSWPSDPNSLFDENPSLPSKFTFLHRCSVQSSLNIHLKENPCPTCVYWPLLWGPSGFSLSMFLHLCAGSRPLGGSVAFGWRRYPLGSRWSSSWV